MFAGIPVVWSLRLASLIALSSLEVECISLSEALREAIPLTHLPQEQKDIGFDISQMQHKVKCKAFEDDTGAIEMATEHKMCPRTEHLNVKFHASGKSAMEFIASEDNPADILTHPVNQERLLECMIMSPQWDLLSTAQEGVSSAA